MGQTPYRLISAAVEQGVLVLTITEPRIQGLDVGEALRAEMLTALADYGATKVVVDFQHAEYISSTAFWPLLSMRRALQETGGRVILCGLSKAIGDVFFTTHMIADSGSAAPLFEMEPTVAEAVARLNLPAPAT